MIEEVIKAEGSEMGWGSERGELRVHWLRHWGPQGKVRGCVEDKICLNAEEMRSVRYAGQLSGRHAPVKP